MRFRLIFSTLLVLSTLQSWGQTYLSRAQVQENVQAMRRMLLHMHPAPDQYCGRDSLEQAFSELMEATADSILRTDFEFRVRQLLRLVGCGHTNIYSRPRSGAQKKSTKSGLPQQVVKILPLKIFANDTAVWLLEALDTTQRQISQGAQLLYFNEKPASTLVGHLRQHQVPDGRVTTTGLRVLNVALYFNFLHRKYFPADTTCRIVWRHPTSGSIDTTRLRACPADSVERWLASRWHRPDTVQYLHKTKDRYFYFHPRHPSTAVLRLESFAGIQPKFYRRIFREMRRRPTTKLVIDLRDNLGGNYFDCKILMRYLSDRPTRVTISRRTFRTWRHLGIWGGVGRVVAFLGKDVFSLAPRRYGWRTVRYFDRVRPFRKARRFEGTIVVLVNGLSASAGAHLPAHLQVCSDRVVVVGEETGGGARTLNAMQTQRLRLPQGSFWFDTPQYHVDFGLGKDSGRGVLPDVPVVYSVSDGLQRRDLEMERALEILPSDASMKPN